ncbi:hypothetical protein ACWC9X_31485 [Streptomyces asoensis]
MSEVGVPFDYPNTDLAVSLTRSPHTAAVTTATACASGSARPFPAATAAPGSAPRACAPRSPGVPPPRPAPSTGRPPVGAPATGAPAETPDSFTAPSITGTGTGDTVLSPAGPGGGDHRERASAAGRYGPP